ncbi:MAG: glutaredoxin family protein [Thermosynechococcaceae cyanobacterium MS004]|nr:glutaredoxin family protein [Thermosynechococcaceae cyanobacterium MS004]
MQRLILYSKSGCHLCEGLQEKLEKILANPELGLAFELEIRDITQREDWLKAYQYEVPVLMRIGPARTVSDEQDGDHLSEISIPRPSPRLTVEQLLRFLSPYLSVENVS